MTVIEPVRIEPDALYDDGSLYQLIGLTQTSLLAARRGGRLRYSRQGNRVIYLGCWILQWLESTGEGPRLTSPASPAEGGTP
jgi:hypothetical protein